MPPETPQTENPKIESSEPVTPRPEESARSTDGPLSFVPHSPAGTEVTRIRTGRYGELEEHELIRLLDTIEDERARGRFRESIYLSLFFWLAVAWLVFYGPRVLWHAPRIKLASEVLKERELTTLNAPVMLPSAPRLKPAPPPKLDTKTLDKLREMTRHEEAAPRTLSPSSTPAPPAPAAIPSSTTPPNLPVPSAPQPSRPAPSVLTEAPAPQPSSRPNFATRSNPSEAMNEIVRSARGGSGGGVGITVSPARGGSSAGAGSEILSDTQGVDFTAWKRRFDRGTIDAWLPLLPEEIQPPLSKKGTTTILLTVLPDGSIGDLRLEGSTHDDAINKAAWGSIISQGKLPALPKEFHGPNLVLRLHYLVNMDR